MTLQNVFIHKMFLIQTNKSWTISQIVRQEELLLRKNNYTMHWNKYICKLKIGGVQRNELVEDLDHVNMIRLSWNIGMMIFLSSEPSHTVNWSWLQIPRHMWALRISSLWVWITFRIINVVFEILNKARRYCFQSISLKVGIIWSSFPFFSL